MTNIKTFLSDEKHQSFLIPAIAIVLGFLSGSIIMLLSGLNPVDLFTSFVRAVTGINLPNIGTDRDVFNSRYFGEFFVFSIPLILTGLSVSFAFRTGLFNIGGEGQVMMGALFASGAGIFLDFPPLIFPVVVLIAGALGGAVWGFIPGILKAKFRVHEVVVTIMLNYTALYVSNFYIRSWGEGNAIRTENLPSKATLQSDLLSSLTNNSRLHWGFIVVIVCAVIFWFIINKTTFGYELKAVGFNPLASEYAGMKVQRNAALSMTIAGAFSGLAGAMLVVGTFGYGRVLPGFENYGFDGIAVALVGGSTALGSVLAGLLFGGLKAAQPIMQVSRIPRDIAIIIIAVIIIYVAMREPFKQLLLKLKAKEEEN